MDNQLSTDYSGTTENVRKWICGTIKMQGWKMWERQTQNKVARVENKQMKQLELEPTHTGIVN